MRDPKDITLLVVDDEEPLRKLFAFDFKRQGFKVLEAKNGMEAFELVKRNKIDLVLSDVRMPGGDGIELLNNIRNDDPEKPVVMLITAFSDLSLEDAYNAGADAVFAKPFNRTELLTKILKAVSARDEVWSMQADWVQTDFEIELQFPDFNTAVSGRILKLGRGGMFVGLDGKFPRVGASTHFRIQFSSSTPQIIVGDGLVRWVRSHVAADIPSGCGIEFVYLSDSTREHLIRVIREMGTKAYIPKH